MTTEAKIYRPLNQAYHDARLVDLNDQGLVLEYQGRQLVLPTFQPISDCQRDDIGKIGIAQWAPEGECWRFNTYLDQSLRRMLELDHGDHIGWRNDASPGGWTAPRCIVPGAGGAFIDDDTEPVQIDVPQEFIALCERYKLTPEAVLRSFIADACDLANYNSEPRADRYTSNGSDERMMASDYLDRAYGMY